MTPLLKTTLLLWILCVGSSQIAGAQNRGPGGPPQPHGPGGPGGPPPPPGGGPPNGAPPSPASPAAGMSRPAGLEFGPVGRWWDNKSITGAVGISHDQQRQMDGIFDANKPAILASYKTLEAEQAKLNAMSANSAADKSAVFAQIDVVNRARSDLQKATAQMLLEIRGKMSAEQVTKLEQIH